MSFEWGMSFIREVRSDIEREAVRLLREYRSSLFREAVRKGTFR